jgi:hypothetical protein
VSKKLVEVRDKFSKFLGPEHLDAPTREIAKAFLDSHEKIIAKDAWREVTITGLVHILGGLRKRRPRPGSSIDGQGLFAGFGIDPVVVVRTFEEETGTVEKNKDLGSLTLPEAMDCLARHTKERASNVKTAREWRRLIAKVKPFMTREGMTLAEGMRAAEAHEAAKKKKDGK